MFNNEKNIIFISKKNITASKVVLGRSPKVITLFKSLWTNETLTEILIQIIKKIGNNFRLLLSDDLVYITSVSIPFSVLNERQVVLEKVQEYIPEDLNKVLWDFTDITIDKKLEVSKSKTVQVVAYISSFIENLRTAVKKSGIIIEAAEPVSYSLSRLTNEEKEPQIIVNNQEEDSSLIFCYQGLVFTVESFDNNPNLDQIKTFINYVKSRFDLPLKKIILYGNSEEIIIDEYKIEKQNLNPYVSIAYKKDLKGKDERTLNLEIPSDSSKPDLKKIPLKLIIIIFCVLIALIGFFITKKPKTTVQKKVVVSKNIPIPSPTTMLNKQEVTISILNGSGVAGVAGKMEEILMKEGYKIAGLGNADNYDYLQTEIRSKEKVTIEFLNSLSLL